jgi:hypothetical protein
VFEPENRIVLDIIKSRSDAGPQLGSLANRLYDEIADVELRGFQLLDQYLTWLLQEGCQIEASPRPLCVSVAYKKATHSMRIRERLAKSLDYGGKQSLTRTGSLCVEIDRSVLLKEPDHDLTRSFPRVLRALKRQGVDTDLLREMHLERSANRQFEALLAPGPRSYEERVRDTIKQFQRMALGYDEARKAKELLALLEATATVPDAATIEILKDYIGVIDPLAHGSDVAMRILTHVLHGLPAEEPSWFG